MNKKEGLFFAILIFLLLNLTLVACALTYLCLYMAAQIPYGDIILVETTFLVISILYAVYECKIKSYIKRR